MKIEIREDGSDPLMVTIRCTRTDSRIRRLAAYIGLFDCPLQAKDGTETRFVNTGEVLWFESVDDRTFLYTADTVMEIALRLYQLESILPEQSFIRISRSQIVNIQKIASLRPELNRTLTATMSSGEHLSVSRKYVPALRRLLSL
ncbi:MAG: LytTR family transcriptional regulator DNA-binding domain-containing protein [Oscillospiraceae bacterium]|nr:LytTR family transcriptional regulator DNA-binding domain-containing protein [Oscillospiraceae bacterium]MBQ7013124.1 LytTR family transcriptional regulator DNA-binding domain-containing protein [Oscillospiraceae bacterium]